MTISAQGFNNSLFKNFGDGTRLSLLPSCAPEYTFMRVAMTTYTLQESGIWVCFPTYLKEYTSLCPDEDVIS